MSHAEGSTTLNLINVILESWLDSKIPKLILVIPAYQIRACVSHDLCIIHKKY